MYAEYCGLLRNSLQPVNYILRRPACRNGKTTPFTEWSEIRPCEVEFSLGSNDDVVALLHNYFRTSTRFLREFRRTGETLGETSQKQRKP